MSRLARLTLPAAAAVLLFGAGCVYHSVPPTSMPPYQRPISLYQARQIAQDYCLRHGQRQVSIVQAARVGPDRYRVLLVSHPRPFVTEHLRVWVASTGGQILDADFQREGHYWRLGQPVHPSHPAWPAGRPVGRPVDQGRPVNQGHPAYGHPAQPAGPAVQARPAGRPAARPMPAHPAHPALRPTPARRATRPLPSHQMAQPAHGAHAAHPAHPARPSKAQAEKAKKDAKKDKDHRGHAVHPAHGD